MVGEARGRDFEKFRLGIRYIYTPKPDFGSFRTSTAPVSGVLNRIHRTHHSPSGSTSEGTKHQRASNFFLCLSVEAISYCGWPTESSRAKYRIADVISTASLSTMPEKSTRCRLGAMDDHPPLTWILESSRQIPPVAHRPAAPAAAERIGRENGTVGMAPCVGQGSRIHDVQRTVGDRTIESASSADCSFVWSGPAVKLD